MDRLSGVLISAICFLMCFSAAIVYTTWFREGPGLSASSVAEIEEEMSLAAIAMNTQKQVINVRRRSIRRALRIGIGYNCGKSQPPGAKTRRLGAGRRWVLLL